MPRYTPTFPFVMKQTFMMRFPGYEVCIFCLNKYWYNFSLIDKTCNSGVILSKYILPHSHPVSLVDRLKIKNHQAAVIWFTGLSGSGKSTIAGQVEYVLNSQYKAHTYLLDGDNIRTGLNKDLDFSETSRAENIRRIGEVSKLFYDAGLIVLTAFISPFRADREQVRALLPEGDFLEIFVDCPLAVCENRDPKGLYRKARQGVIKDFTGLNSPYERPLNPEIILNSGSTSIEDCVQQVIRDLLEKNILRE